MHHILQYPPAVYKDAIKFVNFKILKNPEDMRTYILYTINISTYGI